MTVSMTSAIDLVFPGLLGFGFPGGYEWIILLILGLLIFGRRLPEVGRSLGKSIVEFKKGIRNIESEIDTAPNRVKYTMNGFVIAVGSYVAPLAKQAKALAKKLGKVEVELGGSSCKVPLATETIDKVEKAGRLGKKRKTIKC